MERNVDCFWPPAKPRKKYVRRKKSSDSTPEYLNLGKPEEDKIVIQEIDNNDAHDRDTNLESLEFQDVTYTPNPFESLFNVLELDMEPPGPVLPLTDALLKREQSLRLSTTRNQLPSLPQLLSPFFGSDMEKISKMIFSDLVQTPKIEEDDSENDNKVGELTVLKGLLEGIKLLLPDYPEKIVNILSEKFVTPLNLKFWNSSLDVEMGFKKMLQQLSRKSYQYLEYYVFRYTACVTICPVNSNYFVKTFLPLAYHNEGILYALIAWGCLMYYSREEAKLYLNKASQIIYASHVNRPRRSQDDAFIFLSFLLIVIGWEVCAGDTENWYELLKECKNLAENYGGLLKLSEMYGHTNHIKWLISDLQYHDLMASCVLELGPLFNPSEYSTVLREDVHYGMDPIQGCARPLISIIGEVSTQYYYLKKEWEEVEELCMTMDVKTANMKKLEYYEKCEDIAKSFEEKVSNTRPNLNVLALVKDETLVESHMTLFELYSYICMIYVGIYLRKLPPASTKQQMRLIKSVELIDILINGHLYVSLPFTLLITGINCCTREDREEMTARLDEVSSRYNIGNFRKMRVIIKDAWEMNPDGTKVVDWASLAAKRNWKLYAG